MLPEGAHTRRRGQKVTKSKANKRQLEELLGMPMSTAERKLRKAVIYELARQLRKNRCLECGLEISDPEDLAVVHVEDWRDEPDSYFDLENVAFSHASCRAGRQGRRQGEREMSKIEVKVEDSRGRPLRGCVHEGQLYVGGSKDQRYQVRIKNRTSKSVLLVVTVDGRSVLTGEKGSWEEDGGLVLGPYQSHVFKGWRKSNEEVAAFRLGSKGDAYSSQMGSAENVGIIGVAVFEEKEPPRPIITVKETTYVPYPYVPYGGGGLYGSSGGWSSTTGSPVLGTNFSVNTSTSTSTTLSSTSDSAPILRGRGRRTVSEHRQELGTEFGETLRDKVVECKFERATDEPCEIHTIRYDSIKALEKAGIFTKPPSKKKAPEAFPESPQRFCQPPPKSRWR